MNGTSAAVETSNEEKMKIVDLPDLCLDKILLYLNLSDLANAASTNSVLTTSAVRVFILKYQNQKISFESEYDAQTRNINDIKHQAHADFQSVLNHFGDKIKILDIGFGALSYEEQKKQIFQTILDKCESLIELEIKLNRSWMTITKPFPKLEKLRVIFDEKKFNSSFTDINRWFPNICTLAITIDNGFPRQHFSARDKHLVTELNFDLQFVAHIPNLTDFQWITQYTRFDDVIPFLNANPQMKSLKLACKASSEPFAKFLSNIQYIRNAENLVEIDFDGFTEEYNLKDISRFKNLQCLKLRGRSDCNALRKLRFANITESKIDSSAFDKESVTDFIVNNESLKKIKMRELQPDNLVRIANKPQQLTKIACYYGEFNNIDDIEIAYGILSLLNQYSGLRSTHILYDLGNNHANKCISTIVSKIKERGLNTEWKIKIEDLNDKYKTLKLSKRKKVLTV